MSCSDVEEVFVMIKNTGHRPVKRELPEYYPGEIIGIQSDVSHIPRIINRRAKFGILKNKGRTLTKERNNVSVKRFRKIRVIGKLVHLITERMTTTGKVSGELAMDSGMEEGRITVKVEESIPDTYAKYINETCDSNDSDVVFVRETKCTEGGKEKRKKEKGGKKSRVKKIILKEKNMSRDRKSSHSDDKDRHEKKAEEKRHSDRRRMEGDVRSHEKRVEERRHLDMKGKDEETRMHNKKTDKKRDSDNRRRDEKARSPEKRTKERTSDRRRRDEESKNRDGSRTSVGAVRSMHRSRHSRSRRSTLTPDVSKMKLIEERIISKTNELKEYRNVNVIEEEDDTRVVDMDIESDKVNNIVEDSFVIDTGGYLHFDGHNIAFSSPTIPKMILEIPAEDEKRDFDFSFSSMAKGRKGLALKKVERTAFSTVGYPLGAAFDRILNMFIFTDTGKGEIVFATYEGHEKERLKGFKLPSAIAIMKPASHFAVLDWNGITLIDMKGNQRIVIADDFNGRFRGLASVIDGNLATIQFDAIFRNDRRIWVPPSVVVWSATSHNTIITSIPIYPDRFSLIPTLCSFLCTQAEKIYVTDLDRNTISCFSYMKETNRLSAVAQGHGNNSQLRTRFMSGIVVDSTYSLLVADARGHSISHVAPDGSLLQTLPFLDNSSPYISGIAIAPMGRLMICGRRAHNVQMYDIVPLDSAEDKLANEMYQMW